MNHMAWSKGTSGNPLGRPKRGHALSDALRLKLSEPIKVGNKTMTKAERLAEVAISLGLEGDTKALRFIGEFTEGRPAQQINLNTRTTSAVKAVPPEILEAVLTSQQRVHDKYNDDNGDRCLPKQGRMK